MSITDLYIDIETCPDQTPGALERCIATIEPPGQYKKADSIAAWKAENGEREGRERWLRTALDPLFGGIYVVGFRLPGMAAASTIYREPAYNEAEFLSTALATIFAPFLHEGRPMIPRLIGWNHINFDIPFLAKRCAILDVKPPLRLPTASRYNGDRVLDLMQAWGGGPREYEKQSVVAKAMRIEVGPEIDGSQLWDEVLKGGVAVASKKCADDVDQLFEIHQRMAGAFQL